MRVTVRTPTNLTRHQKELLSELEEELKEEVTFGGQVPWKTQREEL